VLPLVVFDGDCAFCTTSISWLARTFPGSFDTVPYQRADLASLELTAARCDAELQWLTDPTRPGDPAVHRSGAQAVAALLRAGGRRRRGAIGTLARASGTLAAHPPVSWLAAAIYVAVAANRTRLPGGTPACAR
jgi:predicted DCC family thiol-disulfide oxidoreductase YuxK